MTTSRCAFESFAGFEKRAQPNADASAARRNAMREIRFIVHSEDEPQLQLERPRRVDVGEVEDVEGFEPKQDARALGGSDAVLDEERNVRCRRAPERGLGDDLPVDDGAVVVCPVAVVVYAGRRVEGPRGGELPERADGEVERQLVRERDDGAVALVEQARPALFISEPP